MLQVAWNPPSDAGGVDVNGYVVERRNGQVPDPTSDRSLTCPSGGGWITLSMDAIQKSNLASFVTTQGTGEGSWDVGMSPPGLKISIDGDGTGRSSIRAEIKLPFLIDRVRGQFKYRGEKVSSTPEDNGPRSTLWSPSCVNVACVNEDGSQKSNVGWLLFGTRYDLVKSVGGFEGSGELEFFLFFVFCFLFFLFLLKRWWVVKAAAAAATTTTKFRLTKKLILSCSFSSSSSYF